MQPSGGSSGSERFNRTKRLLHEIDQFNCRLRDYVRRYRTESFTFVLLRLRFTLTPGEEFVERCLHLRLRNVFLMCCHRPRVTEWILNLPGAVAIKLILYRSSQASSFGNRARRKLVHVRYV